MALIAFSIGTPWNDTSRLFDGFYWYAYGYDGDDTIYGGDDGNEIWGGAGNDRLFGGTGSDRLIGEDGNDSLSGGVGYDNLWGGAGADTLLGGSGNDLLDGGSGNDRLIGSTGFDRMIGGTGSDVFVFLAIGDGPGTRSVYDWEPTGTDIIVDFTRGSDRIDLSAIDADPAVAGNQAFDFLGWDTSPYYGGTVSFRASYNSRTEQSGWEVEVSVSTDPSVPELVIFVAGTTPLTAADFIL
jgi:Ca2+-binding RTX toxin-like protein